MIACQKYVDLMYKYIFSTDKKRNLNRKKVAYPTWVGYWRYTQKDQFPEASSKNRKIRCHTDEEYFLLMAHKNLSIK